MLVTGHHSYLIFKVVTDYPGDFIEARRSFRIGIATLLIAVPFVWVVNAMLVGQSLSNDYPSLFQVVCGFFLTATFLLLLVNNRVPYFFAEADPAIKDQSSLREKSSQDIDPMDLHSLEILKTKMEDGLCREQGLSIAQIAYEIQIPEYRLRKLINEHLGYRNISQYLNTYRIAETKVRLASASDRHLSILTIAMDVGFLSLRSFNRAFKESTGQTPSELQNCSNQ